MVRLVLAGFCCNDVDVVGVSMAQRPQSQIESNLWRRLTNNLASPRVLVVGPRSGRPVVEKVELLLLMEIDPSIEYRKTPIRLTGNTS